MSDSENAIEVKGIKKDFILPHENVNSLKQLILHPFRNKTKETQHVLKSVDFEVKKGEFFGIVGRNGSGKSTLLKILAGIYEPTNGSVQVNGSLVPFIELGVGFNPELSGKDNVFLNGALLGFSRKQVSNMYDDIVEFAELERFMDQKVKNYSSGMQVRLAFSIAVKAETDIILIDEVLAVGDANFQAKCYDYFHKLKKNKKTVVFISHDMGAVQQYCDRAIIIEQGNITKEGNPKDISRSYEEINFSNTAKDLEKKNASDKNNVKRWGNGDAEIVSVTTSQNGKKSTVFSDAKEIEFTITFKTAKEISEPVIGMTVNDPEGKPYFATNSKSLNVKTGKLAKDKTYTAVYTVNNIFTDGRYSISCAVNNTSRSQPYARVEDITYFEVGGRDLKHSITHPQHSFELK